MILGGDEFFRTQGGNNNAYCQNNALSWYDWKLLEENTEIFDFVRRLIRFRANHNAFLRPEFYTGTDGNYNAMPDITWFNEKGKEPDWETQKKLLALRIDGSEAPVAKDRDENDYYLLLNASPAAKLFTVGPPREGMTWHKSIDTALPGPRDIREYGKEPLLRPQNRCLVESRSLVLLLSR
jgi:glycogen operon protein